LRVTATCTAASPFPAAGVTAAHATSLLAVHVHAGWAWTSTRSSPPSGPTAVALVVTVKRHGAGFCAMDNWCSATVNVPCRATGSLFSATRNDTVPSPCPSVAEVVEIHETCDAARQEHSRATPIETVPVPPVGANVVTGELTVASQRGDAAVGLATVVDVELPHARAARAKAAAVNESTPRTARQRAFTSRAQCRKVARLPARRVL
jgi:hypothetical protein